MTVTIPELTPGKAKALLTLSEKERAFWGKHFREFREKYPDQYVIVHNGEVIGTSPDIHEVEALLHAKGLDIRDVWMKFMADPNEPLIV